MVRMHIILLGRFLLNHFEIHVSVLLVTGFSLSVLLGSEIFFFFEVILGSEIVLLTLLLTEGLLCSLLFVL